MRILAPGVRLTALRDDGAEISICQYVRPRCRRALAGAGGDDVFAPIGREAAEIIGQDQRVLHRRAGAQRGRGQRHRWRGCRCQRRTRRH